jgi:hypothetical protein
MERRWEPGKRLKAGNIRLAALLPFFLLGLPGCAGNNNNKLAHGDPLYGETQPRGPGPAPASPPPQPPNNNRGQGQVPPVPTATSSPSNAAMASSGLPGGRPLAIAQNDPGGAGTAAVPSAPVNLKRPEPIVVPIPRENALPGPGVVPSNVLTTGAWAPQQPASPPNQANLVGQQAANSSAPVSAAVQAQLRARGATWWKEESVPEGVRFSCIVVPNPANLDSTRVFEATARDSASAVQAVLQQIDQQR